MTKFNSADKHSAFRVVDKRSSVEPSPLVTTDAMSKTFEGAPGYLRDAKSELFLLATTSLDLFGVDAFYESASERTQRFIELVKEVAPADPHWMGDFLIWLRGPGNLRTVAVVGSVHASLAMIEADIVGSRTIINQVCQRADEPGEVLAYARRVAGGRVPAPVKRGVADAAQRLYSEFSLLKYDTPSHAYRFGDVIDIVHPTAVDAGQSRLFRYALDRRHNRPDPHDEYLDMVRRNTALRVEAAAGIFDGLLDPAVLGSAGMTWEDSLSLAGSKVDKRELWKALLPSMGFMAVLRNLRNFDQAGLTDEEVSRATVILQNPVAVQQSRQLPMRFLTAYRNVPSLRWSYPLEKALELSLSNIPELPGRTLVLIDTSGSMDSPFSPVNSWQRPRSVEEPDPLMRWDAAAMFGLALARRCETADVVSFSSESKPFHLRAGASLLSEISRFQGGYFLNAGTDTVGALSQHYAGHNRVVILTDEQDGWYFGGNSITVSSAMPQDKMLWTFNLAGYGVAQVKSSPTRVTIGGLTDHMFRLIPQVESARDGWPWEIGE